MSESNEDKLSRVRLMATGSDIWDFSDNDVAALKHVLERLEKCEADYKRCCELNERLCYEVHDLKATLEKCEAALRICRTCQCVLCNAARAAVEGK